MGKITQEMKYRQSLMKYAERNGVLAASRKYNKSRSYIYFWKTRWDGSEHSLLNRSRRPHHHPNQHREAELEQIRNLRRRKPELGLFELWYRLRNRGYERHFVSLYRVIRRLELLPDKKPKAKYVPKPYEQMTRPGERVQIDVKVVPAVCRTGDCPKLYQYTAIDEYTRHRYLGAYEEQSTYSSADFLRKAVRYFRRNNIPVECIQTDNGFEFTNRFLTSCREIETLFERTAREMGISHKKIRPYTPRHNGKVERSHREDQKRFYDSHRFFSLADFDVQLAAHQSRSNRIPMRPLNFLSPRQFLHSLSVQHV